MEDIFEIKLPLETEMKEKVILKFSNKQGGDYNIFSYYWQCFVWAATIGFLRNERRPLASGTERIFSLNTMRGNGGDKDAQALICMCIARIGSVDIMRTPSEAIQVISEYANGGFYHIIQLMENGENTFNDFEKVKQEIFSRNYTIENSQQPNTAVPKINKTPTNNFQLDGNDKVVIENKEPPFFDEPKDETPETPKVPKQWTHEDISDLKSYYKLLSIEQLAGFFSRSEDDVKSQMQKLGLL